MTPRKENPFGHSHIASALLFVLFLIALAVLLNGVGWCVDGVCEVGTDLVLP